jgi:hypothetical protein
MSMLIYTRVHKDTSALEEGAPGSQRTLWPRHPVHCCGSTFPVLQACCTPHIGKDITNLWVLAISFSGPITMCSPFTLSQISLIKLSTSAPQNSSSMLNQFQNFMSASSTLAFIPKFFVRDIGVPSLNRIKGCTLCRGVCLHSVN